MRAARGPLVNAAGIVVARALGGRVRSLRILGGAARGGRMELDLAREKAYWAGIYEPDVQAVLRERLRPGSVFWDVGAHVGFFSVCAARLGARVVAFEPAPENLTRLRRHAALNGFEVIGAAAWRDSQGVSLTSGPTSEQWRADGGGEVASVALDDVARERGLPDLIKLDVEGAEAAVLAGATEILAARRTAFMCELHGDEQAAQVRDLLAGWRLTPVGSAWRLLAEPPA